MATVTGMTAVAMQAIADGSVVAAHFDSANQLILTQHDGSLIDGGHVSDATTTVSGLVELATSAETQAGTDATRAVTPAGLASLPGYKVQILAVNAIAESADPTEYPFGSSLMSLNTGSGWSIGGGFGTVLTEFISTSRAVQTLYENSGGTASTKAWVREYNDSVGGGGWTAWAQMLLAVRLNEASYSQSATMTSYPSGKSFLYYTTANGGSWDFSGTAGTVETLFLVDKNYASQIFTQHATGGSVTPSMWIRTSNTTSGWSAWKKLIHDPGGWTSYTPTWTTSSGLHLPSFGNAVINCNSIKIGRKADVRFEIVFGNTTNFGSSAGTSDNWDFSLPYAAARTSDTIGWLQLQQSNDLICVGRSRLVTATTFRTSISSGMANGASVANTGDVDSLSPWTWTDGDSLKGQFTYETAS